MSDWQDIATAPRDGTPVLVFDEGAIVIAQWDDGSWWDHGRMEPAPTHWMSLPAPPRDADTRAQGD